MYMHAYKNTYFVIGIFHIYISSWRNRRQDIFRETERNAWACTLFRVVAI